MRTDLMVSPQCRHKATSSVELEQRFLKGDEKQKKHCELPLKTVLGSRGRRVEVGTERDLVTSSIWEKGRVSWLPVYRAGSDFISNSCVLMSVNKFYRCFTQLLLTAF